MTTTDIFCVWTVADFPAMEVLDTDRAITPVSDDTVMAVEYPTARYGMLYSRVRFGSVAGYARKYREDPAPAIARAIDLGHPLHYVMGMASIISDTRTPKERLFLLKDGARISFDGVLFDVTVSKDRQVRLKAA